MVRNIFVWIGKRLVLNNGTKRCALEWNNISHALRHPVYSQKNTSLLHIRCSVPVKTLFSEAKVNERWFFFSKFAISWNSIMCVAHSSIQKSIKANTTISSVKDNIVIDVFISYFSNEKNLSKFLPLTLILLHIRSVWRANTTNAHGILITVNLVCEEKWNESMM